MPSCPNYRTHTGCLAGLSGGRGRFSQRCARGKAARDGSGGGPNERGEAGGPRSPAGIATLSLHRTIRSMTHTPAPPGPRWDDPVVSALKAQALLLFHFPFPSPGTTHAASLFPGRPHWKAGCWGLPGSQSWAEPRDQKQNEGSRSPTRRTSWRAALRAAESGPRMAGTSVSSEPSEKDTHRDRSGFPQFSFCR